MTLSQGQLMSNCSRSNLPEHPLPQFEDTSTWWTSLSQFLTCLIPDFILRKIFPNDSIRQAWREKVALCYIIALNCIVLAFLTYGINMFLCTGSDKMVFGKLNPDNFPKDNIIVGNGGIFYTDEYFSDIDNKTHLFNIKSDACKNAFGNNLNNGKIDASELDRIEDIHFTWSDISKNGFIAIDGKVYDPRTCNESYFDDFIEKYSGGMANTDNMDSECLECFKDVFYAGKIYQKSNGCIFADIMLWITTVVIFALILIRFLLAFIYAWYTKTWRVSVTGKTPVINLVTCYTEDENGLKGTLDSLCDLDYDNDHRVIVVVADGQVKGAGNNLTTPDIIRKMCVLDDPEPQSYLSLAPGSKRINRAKIHTGYYEKDGKRAKLMLINKVGNTGEVTKAGNRGKRDSQVILMSFFSKILYNDRLSDLDVEMYRKFQILCPHYNPKDFEVLLMLDADTIIEKTALTKLVSVFESDHKVLGLCGETKLVNKTESWVTMIQVFEYYISHHLAKNFESVFGGVTCLPGCFCAYRIKIVVDNFGNIKNYADRATYSEEKWTTTPLLANPLIVSGYSIYEAKTLHQKNLLNLGEDRYLTVLLMRNFYKRKLLFVPSAKCYTCAPADYKTLQSQRRRWINSTIHNLFELVLVDKLCGTFCCSMQFVIGLELFGTLVLPAAIFFTGFLIVSSILYEPAWIPLIMLVGILGLPPVLIAITTFELQYCFWCLIYVIALPIWNFCLPVYSFWHFDDFSWGDTRKAEGKDVKEEVGEYNPKDVRLRSIETLDL